MKRLMIAAAVLLMTSAPAGVFAQIPEDALRLGTPGIGVGARAIGNGGAYTGVHRTSVHSTGIRRVSPRPCTANSPSAELQQHRNTSTYFGTGDQYSV